MTTRPHPDRKRLSLLHSIIYIIDQSYRGSRTQVPPLIKSISESRSQFAPHLDQTGNPSPLAPTAPAIISNPFLSGGPMTGIFPANPAIVPRKSPNRITIPYNSTTNPISAHRKRMRRIPAAKASVPLSFCRRAKKRKVFCRPIVRVRPMRKRIYGGVET